MIIAILYTLAALAAVVGAIAGILYPFTCKALENHLGTTIPDFKEDEAGFGAWYKKRWALDKKRKNIGLPALGAYAVGMFSLIVAQALTKAPAMVGYPLVAMLVLTAALLVIGLRSTIHNSRIFTLELRQRYPY